MEMERHQLVLQQPLRFQQSHDVLASFWEDIRQGAHVQLFVLPVMPASNTDSASCNSSSSGSVRTARP